MKYRIKLLLSLLFVALFSFQTFAAEPTPLRLATFQADVTPPMGSVSLSW